MAYLGDMKQQQELAGFLGARAIRSCWFCDADTGNWGDLNWDIISHGRYHHQVLALRKEAKLIPIQTKRNQFLSACGLAYQPSALAYIHSILDTVLSYPPDPVTSETQAPGLPRRFPN